jgi:ABC-type bacteriocin/lantibiotic exporter with double-glycine peptidase domain
VSRLFGNKARRGAAGAGPLSVIMLLVLSASCTTTGNAPPGVSTPVIEGIPFYPQEAYQCGPASLAAVLNFHGVAVTPDDIAADIFSSGAKGTLGIDMVLYARKKGLRADQYSGGPDDLKRTLEAGNPVIILVDYGFWVYQKAHFMVLLGYNEKGFIADSGREHLKFISQDELKRIWEKTRFWTLVIRK